MYVNIEIPVKCSKCGAIGFFEDVTRNRITKRRCLKCGHESVIRIMSIYPEEETGYIEYNYKQPKFFEF